MPTDRLYKMLLKATNGATITSLLRCTGRGFAAVEFTDPQASQLALTLAGTFATDKRPGLTVQVWNQLILVQVWNREAYSKGLPYPGLLLAGQQGMTAGQAREQVTK